MFVDPELDIPCPDVVKVFDFLSGGLILPLDLL
jgi:hypothetical protein